MLNQGILYPDYRSGAHLGAFNMTMTIDINQGTIIFDRFK
jgi:hypothetical protein